MVVRPKDNRRFHFSPSKLLSEATTPRGGFVTFAGFEKSRPCRAIEPRGKLRVNRMCYSEKKHRPDRSEKFGFLIKETTWLELAKRKADVSHL